MLDKVLASFEVHLQPTIITMDLGQTIYVPDFSKTPLDTASKLNDDSKNTRHLIYRF